MGTKEIIHQIFTKDKKEMHIKEIAENALSRKLISEIPVDLLTNRIGRFLTQDVKKGKNSCYVKVKNKKGGFKRGCYKLKRKRKTETQKTIGNIKKGGGDNIPNSEAKFIGKGGEFSVLSELIFNGFNANIMSLDDGIDIVASKNHKLFYIQVKTTYVKEDKINSISIKSKSFKRYDTNDTFYVIALRYYKDNSPHNNYLIFSSYEIEKYLEEGFISNKKEFLTMTLKANNVGRIHLTSKGAETDVTYNFNKFSLIK